MFWMGEFVAHGFHDIPLSLYCNGKLLYNETVAPEITTFSLNLSELDETFNINTEYSLDLYYILNNKRLIVEITITFFFYRKILYKPDSVLSTNKKWY